MAQRTELIGQAPDFLEAVAHASRLATVDRPVLVLGERGTGKELIAERLHYLSSRWDGPYETVNCAALPADLLDSALFGHARGAFTGAVEARDGRLQRAHGGTLFLDELGAAPLSVQEKLLRAVEYGEVERVGGAHVERVDVRIIAATNENLLEKVATGSFRADLLDRLAFDAVLLPPLRARWEDIPILADHFGQRAAAEMGAASFPGFTYEAMSALMDHPWPGNVRELRNVVERSVFDAFQRNVGAMTPIGRLRFSPFPRDWQQVSGPASAGHARDETVMVQDHPSDHRALPMDLRARLAEVEIAAVDAALAARPGDQKGAARLLGLSFHQLRGLMRKHDLVPNPRRAGENRVEVPRSDD